MALSWRLLRFFISNPATVCASALAIGSADSIAACTRACPAMLLAPRPRAAICAVALRKAPAAHAGVLPPSKSAISVSSWPFTVALSLGVAVAACICSVN